MPVAGVLGFRPMPTTRKRTPSKPQKSSKRAKTKPGDKRVDGSGKGKGSRAARERAGTALPKIEPTDKCNGLREDRQAYCEQPAGHGTEHPGYGRCSKHGGSTELANRGAAMQQAMQLVEVYGTPQQTDPHTALLQELERTSGHVSWLFIKVNEIGSREGGEENLVGPVGESGIDLKSGTMHHPNTEANIWLKLYQGEREHLVKVARACVAAGIEERRVQIAEAQGQLMARAIQNIVTRLGVGDHPELGKIVREELMQVSAVGAPQPAGAGQQLPELSAGAA